MARFSRTVIAVNRRRPSGTIAMPAAQNRCAGIFARSRPSSTSDPAAMRFSPAMTLISVVLPAPFGPTTQTSSPAATSSDTSHSAVAAPYFATTFLISSMRLAQESRDDIGLLHDVGGFAFGNDPSMIENDDAIRQRHDRAHHVLDEDDPRARIA